MKNFFTFSRVTLVAAIVAAALAVTFTALPAEAAGNICCTDRGEGQLSTLDNGRTFLRWNMVAAHQGIVLTVSGPCGVIQRRYNQGETPTFDLEEFAPDDTTGSYNWELRIDPVIDPEVQDQLASVRGTSEEEEVFKALRRKGLLPQGPFIQTGLFEVVEGVIVDFTQTEKEGLRAEMPRETAPGAELGVIGAGAATGGISNVTGEQVISGDLVVYNSICVGFDCPTNPSFGADTIRLQENNLRIHVDDTSTAASYPNQDWRLEFNSNANGGGEYFRVIDATANRSIMTLEANAPSHSLYVDNGGRVGMGTSNPVLELHVVDGDTPALRLEQDTSSGFAAQTWDVAGNETSFFVRDATNGSTLPFRIFPGESSNALVIRNDGIGVGTTSPAAPMHIVRSASPGFMLEDNNGTGASQWEFELNANGLFQVNKAGSGGAEVLIRERQDPGGLETMDVDGSIEADAFNLSSSRTFKTEFEPVDAASVLARVVELPVAHWTFKWDEQGTRHIGPMAEDFLAAFGVGNDSKNISVGDVSGVALAAIQGLNQVVEEKDARITQLEERLAGLPALEQRIAELEARLAQGQADER